LILRSKRKLSQLDNQLEKHDEPKVESKNDKETDKIDTKKVKSWEWGKGLEPDSLIAHSILSKGPQRVIRFPLEDTGEDLSLGEEQGMRPKK
jgi:hypothetical protein